MIAHTPITAQRGQSMIEYVILCAVLAFFLGINMIDNNSVLFQLVTAFQTAYQNFSYAISLPL